MEFVWTDSLDQNPDARAIRMEVFVEEQGYDAEMEFDCQDARARHLTVYQDGEAAAAGRILQEKADMWLLGRIAVRKARRGTGLGAALVAEMARKAEELGARELHVSAQTQAQGFYEKMGFAADEKATYMDGHIPHIHMKKVLPQD